ncbi:hypothetical protein PMAYCL1PPCAC_00470, partial [Pristionchus mayeri]
ICQHFQLRDTVKIANRLKTLFGMEIQFMGLTMEEKEIFFAELVRQIEEEPLIPCFPYLYCAFCDRCLFTARQIFMHIASREHNFKSTNACELYEEMNSVLIMLVGRWRTSKMTCEEVEKVIRQRQKWRSIRLGDVSSPTMDQLPTGARLADYVSEMYVDGSRFTNAKIFEAIVRFMIGDDSKIAVGTLAVLNERIGKTKTRCLQCKLIFANATEYFAHLLTYSHIRSVETFDANTIVVNLLKHNIARLMPWPKLDSSSNAAVAARDWNHLDPVAAAPSHH